MKILAVASFVLLCSTVASAQLVDQNQDSIDDGSLSEPWSMAGTGSGVGDLLAVQWSTTTSPVWRLHSTTGAGTMIGFSGYPRLNSLARNSAGIHYSATSGADAALIRVDPATGAGTPVAPIDLGGVLPDIRALAFSPQDELYASNREAGNIAALYRLDAQTGVGTPIGPMTDGVQALAFSPGGTLYGWSLDVFGHDQGLVTIDLATGEATDVDPAFPQVDGTPIGGCQGLNFDENGNLFCCGWGLHAVDPTTGDFSTIGGVGDYSVRGAEFVNAPARVPLDSPLGLVVLAALLLGGAVVVFRLRWVG